MVQRSVPLPQRSGLEVCCLCLINQLLVQLGVIGHFQNGFVTRRRRPYFQTQPNRGR